MPHGAVDMDEISPLQSSPEPVPGTCKYEFVAFLICSLIRLGFYWGSAGGHQGEQQVVICTRSREGRGISSKISICSQPENIELAHSFIQGCLKAVSTTWILMGLYNHSL